MSPGPHWSLVTSYFMPSIAEEWHKNRKRPGNTHHVNDIRWTRCGVEEVHVKISYTWLDFTIERFVAKQDPRVHTRLRTSRLTGKKLAVKHIGHCPPKCTSRPPDIMCFQDFPVFCCSFVYYTECKPKNKNKGKPIVCAPCIVCICLWVVL